MDKWFLMMIMGLAIGCLAMAAIPQPTSIPVFPGAQGFGVDTPAGRGGVILYVTNLKDHGKGSLRKAIAHRGPRIIVFEVSGIIKLSSALEVKHPFVTIAGQTAPAPGITLSGDGMRIITHDVLVKHLRIRPGDAQIGTSPAYRDALQILGREAHHVVIDHVSASWAVDENISLWGGAHDVTISNCIISEGLHHSNHPKGPHSMGMLIGDHSKNVAVLNNLFAHNNARNPRIKGDVTAVIVNNLIYNPGKESVAIGSVAGPSLVALVGNKMLVGPDSNLKAAQINILDTADKETGVYQEDNLWFEPDEDLQTYAVINPPVWHHSIRVRNSRFVEGKVLASAGARPSDRDEVDNRILREVKERSGEVIDSPKEKKDESSASIAYREFVLPEDPAGDRDRDGYTNIEKTLHKFSLVVERGR
jgi:pectate lyase